MLCASFAFFPTDRASADARGCPNLFASQTPCALNRIQSAESSFLAIAPGALCEIARDIATIRRRSAHVPIPAVSTRRRRNSPACATYGAKPQKNARRKSPLPFFSSFLGSTLRTARRPSFARLSFFPMSRSDAQSANRVASSSPRPYEGYHNENASAKL